MDGLVRKTGIGFFKRLLGAAELATVVHARAELGTRILVVDDSPTICMVLGRMLQLDGYAVLKTNDGKSAIELACSEVPELIFLDVVMPDINGFAVLRTLRHDPLTKDIPIVMISGNPQATEQFYLQRFGADDFMRKPFDADDVQACIDGLVSAGRLPGRTLSAGTGAVLPDYHADEVIPDIAMPDADLPATTHAALVSLRQ